MSLLNQSLFLSSRSAMISSAVAITPLEVRVGTEWRRLNRSQTPIPLFIFAFELIAFLHSNLLTVHYLAQDLLSGSPRLPPRQSFHSFPSRASLFFAVHPTTSRTSFYLAQTPVAPSIAVVGFLVFFVANIHRIVTNPPPIGFIILGSYRHRLDFADFVAAFVIISLTVAQAFLLGQQRQANTTNPQVGPADQGEQAQEQIAQEEDNNRESGEEPEGEDAFQETDVASTTKGFGTMRL
ncbi:hypothetical protein FRC02_011452 [Tulasnella sp. 418]|nr:hypothetical protein FRC02_011452 [Tulasnella sp. 418]